MLKRRIILPPEHLYPADEWRIVEARYSDEFVGLTETVFSLGNGFVGVRGSFEEGRPALVPGTFVNGFHETWPIVHAEGAPALAKTGQTIVNVPDTTIIKLYVDDEPFFLPTARLRDYGRILDMRAGTLARELVWATAWMTDANTIIAPILGLPELPVADLGELPGLGDPAWPEHDQGAALSWKTRALVTRAAGRPFAWVDDELTDADRAWVAAHHPGRALLHRVDSRAGLTGADLAAVEGWLRAL